MGRLRPQLVRFARARLRNPVHAEDAVQETLLAAIENIESFSGGSSLSSWLTGILKHKIVDCVRRAARDQWQELDNDGTPSSRDDGESQVLHGASLGCPERELARRQFWSALLQCIQTLPERTAETFLLREFVGMNTAETCRVLAASESNCAVMLHRAKARIRASLAPEWSEP